MSSLLLRFGFKIVEQSIENKNDRTRGHPSRTIIIRAFTIHTKAFTLPHLTSTSQSLLWPARSTLYQAPKLSSRVTAPPRAQSARRAGRVRPGVHAALRGLYPLLLGAQCSLGRCHLRRVPCTRKKGRRHSTFEMIGRQKAWRY